MITKSKIKNQKSKMTRGFTFVEVIIATFIFVVIMTALTAIFSSAFRSYRSGKAIQKDLEVAQQAMNIMAKTLRTSKVVASSASAITVYDYSQADISKECIKYEFTGNNLKFGSVDVANEDSCTSSTTIMTYNMTTGTVTGNFYVTPSSDTLAGKMTIAAKVCPATGCTGIPRDEAKIQSTVSLRNEYEELAP